MYDLSAQWMLAILENQPDARELIQYSLHAMFPLARFCEPCSPLHYVERYSAEPPTAIVIGYKFFADIDGLSVTRSLRVAGFMGPIVMITSADQLADQAIAAGASAFLSFDRWAELPVRLAQLITEFDARIASIPSRAAVG